jgi:hypothetical protein
MRTHITDSHSVSHRINLTEASVSLIISAEIRLKHKQLFNKSLMDSVPLSTASYIQD